MTTRVEAIYEDGVLKLPGPLDLEDRTRVQVTIETAESYRIEPPPNLGAVEADLLQKINVGLPAELWERYRGLLEMRRSGTLNEKDQAALVALSDRIEEASARRGEHLLALAHLRRVSLEALMHDLRITAPAYE